MHINKKIALFVLLIIISVNALAVLPLVAFAPILESAIESFIVDSVANETIATIGTAANDASWVDTFTTWLQAGRALSRIAVSAGVNSTPATYDVELNPSDAANEPKGAFQDEYVLVSSFLVMGTDQSSDGQLHSPPVIENLDAATAVSDSLAWWNSYANSSWQYSNPSNCGIDGSGRYVCWVDYPGCPACQPVKFDITPTEQPDSIKRVIRQSDVFTADTTDPDWSASQAAAINGVSALRFWNSQKTAFIDVVANSGGATAIDYQEQVDATTVREEEAFLDANNVPSSSLNLTQQGAISSQPTVSSGTSSIQFPTDYNREGTQQSVLNALTTAPSTNPDLATQKSQLDTNADAHKQVIDDLGNKGQDNEGGVLSWSLSQPVEQDNTCSDPSFDLFQGSSIQRVVTFTGFCDSLMKVRSLLEWVLYIFTLVYLFRVATARTEGA